MEKISIIFLTILIIENLLLTTGLTIYLYRTCQKCQKVKEIDRMFTKLCERCKVSVSSQKGNGKKWKQL